MTRIVAHPLTSERWGDLERLFGPNGAFSNCWCTFLRQTGTEYGAGCANKGAGNRALLRRLTDEGREPGLIGYAGDEPVGWVSVGPRPGYGRILRSPNARVPRPEAADPSVWVVACFYIPRQNRRKGLGRALLTAAVAHARRRGAGRLEAFPVDTGGKRIPSNTIYTGTLDLFLEAGFHRAARGLPGRPVMELQLA